MEKQYRLIKKIDTWRKDPLCYAVQIKKHFWIFSWWEYLRCDSWGSIVLFSDREDAIKYAKEFLQGRIVKGE